MPMRWPVWTAGGWADRFGLPVVTLVDTSGAFPGIQAEERGQGEQAGQQGGAFALGALSVAGIPPTAGFVGKLVAFTAGWKGGYAWLVATAILFSVVAAYIYIRMIVVMFFRDPVDDEVEVVPASWMTWLVVAIGAIGTIALGVWSGPLLDLAEKASIFLR